MIRQDPDSYPIQVSRGKEVYITIPDDTGGDFSFLVPDVNQICTIGNGSIETGFQNM
jgi:hypothetical protein